MSRNRCRGRPPGVVPIVEVGKLRQWRGGWGINVKLADGRWSLRKLEAGSKKDAERARDQKVAELAMGQAGGGGPARRELTFEELAKMWRAKYAIGPDKDHPLKVSGPDSYSRLKRFTFPVLGSLPLSALTTLVLQDWYDGLKVIQTERTDKPLSWQTRQHTLGAVKSVLNRGIEWEFLTRNPAAYVKTEARDQGTGEISALSTEEVSKLLDEASPDLRPLYATAIFTGMRRGELCGLQWGDLDLAGRFITVRRCYRRPRTKNGKVEVIGVPGELVPILKRWRLAWGRVNGCGRPPGSADWVFPVPGSLDRAGKPVIRNRGSHYSFPADLSTATGGRVTRFHDLRHTAATLLLEAGASPVAVQRQLRHSRFSVTEKYLNMRPSWLRDEVSRLSIDLSRRGEEAAEKAAASGERTVNRTSVEQSPKEKSPSSKKLRDSSGVDGTRTRGLRRDRPAL